MTLASIVGRASWRSLSTPAGLLLAANVMLAAAAGTAAMAVWRAARLDPMPTAAPPTAAPIAEPGTLLALRDPGEARELDNDPFRADRQLPELEADASDVAAAPAPEESLIAIETVRLVGTVVLPGSRSFAVYQLPSQTPRTLRVGERLGGLRLEAVAPGRIVLRAPGGERVELHLLKPGG